MIWIRKSISTNGLTKPHGLLEDAQWTVQVENKKTQELQDFTCDFLFLCGGYYNYEEGYTPHFEGKRGFTSGADYSPTEMA